MVQSVPRDYGDPGGGERRSSHSIRGSIQNAYVCRYSVEHLTIFDYVAVEKAQCESSPTAKAQKPYTSTRNLKEMKTLN